MPDPGAPSHADLAHRLIALRRDLHRHPELSGNERRTAAVLAEALRGLGLEPRTGVGGHGVVVDLPAPVGSGGPVIAFRADMDALPIQEETGLPFASERPGVMHACGHDGHSAILVGAAALTLNDADRAVPLRLLFQPAEETGEGASALIEDGALDGVAAVYGLHVDLRHPPGVVVAHEGAVNASTDDFLIELRGPGGHAARPHEAVDPVMVGSAIVGALQTIVAREVRPTDPAVITVGRFQAGSAANVITTSAVLEGTIRTGDAEVRRRLLDAVRRVVHGIAAAHRADLSFTITGGTPPVINRQPWVAVAREAATAVVGADNVVPLPEANMGGEDFGFYLERVPGCFVRLGARPDLSVVAPAHSAAFAFDEQALIIGARYFQALARLGRAAGQQGR